MNQNTEINNSLVLNHKLDSYAVIPRAPGTLWKKGWENMKDWGMERSDRNAAFWV